MRISPRTRGEWVEPVSTSYRGYDVWEIPPNGQGIAALQILNILEGYDLKAMGRGSADFWHVFIEAKKRAFADRAKYYADPAFASIPLKELLSKERAAKAAGGYRHGQGGVGRPCAARRWRQRHHLHDRGGQGRDDGQPDPVQLSRDGFGAGARRRQRSHLGLHVPGSRRAVQPRCQTCQCLCAGQAAVPHDHPRLHDQGRQALCCLSA
jgi:hypothetical protein